MSVYVDQVFDCPGPRGYSRWCHMVADTIDELHEMADKIGHKRSWFQDKPRFAHYDLTPSRRRLAVKYGAIEVSAKEIVAISRRAICLAALRAVGEVVE